MTRDVCGTIGSFLLLFIPSSQSHRMRKSEFSTAPKFAELAAAIGDAVMGWSKVEHALCEAFAVTTGMPTTMAGPIFFSARSFNGKHDMLEAAIKAFQRKEQNDEVEQKSIMVCVFKSGLKKSERWSSTRNVLAHDRPIVTALGEVILSGALAPNLFTMQVESDLHRMLSSEDIQKGSVSV